MIHLNLEQIYNIEAAKFDDPVLIAEFDAPQKNGSMIRMYVKLSPHPDPFLTDVYNLCLGPEGENGEIDDAIRLKHEDVGKVFSTVIFIAYVFLLDHREFTIGLDGSNDIRANLYHSMFLLNREQMAEYFVTVGVDWYVKLMRDRVNVECDEDGNPLFKPKIEPFDYTRTRKELYGYYMFSLK